MRIGQKMWIFYKKPIFKRNKKYLFDFDTIKDLQIHSPYVWQNNHQNSQCKDSCSQGKQDSQPHVEEGEIFLIDHIYW